MDLSGDLFALVNEPSARGVWDLRGDFLAAGLSPDSKPLDLLAEFFRFLDRLETGGSSQDHSEKASLMEVGALSGVVASDLAEAETAREWAERLLSAAFTEGLAVLATRQHVRAWRGELASVYREAAWFLYDELWSWASRRKPDLDPGKRRVLLDQLFEPIHSNAIPPGQKTVLLCSLFLLLLIDSLPEEETVR